MSIKSNGGIFGRNPTFNNVDVEGNLSIDGQLTVAGEVITGLDYQGGWNASTNNPDIAASSPVTGQFWIVTTDGSTDVGGITNWTVGDWALFDGTNWQRVEGGNTDLDTGVSGTLKILNGGTGATDAATARTNLGLGTAATTDSTAYATAAQGTKADSALQPADIGVTVQAYDTSILTTADIDVYVQGYDPDALSASDIGVSVQGYDVDTAKLDVAQTFTATQTFNDISIVDLATIQKLDSTAGTEAYLFLAPTTATGNIRGAKVSAINDGSNGIGLKFYTGAGAAITSKVEISGDDYGHLKVNTGNLVIGTSGSGIDFSATGDAGGMTSELLDDYEEGEWTPVISDGTNNATASVSNSGTYTKIGNTVFYRARAAITSLGSVSGSVRITGLPFTIGSSNSNYGGGQTIAGASGVSVTAGQAIGTLPVSTTAYINLYLWDGSGGISALQASELTSSADLYLSGQYSI